MSNDLVEVYWWQVIGWRQSDELWTPKAFKVESDWSFPVTIQDEFTDIIDVYMCKIINTTTLFVNSTIDTKIITLTTWHGALAWNMICFKEWSNFLQAEILNVNTNIITIDRPLDFAFTTSAIVDITTNDLNVDWSITPQIFRISPSWLNVKFDITRVIFSIEDNVPMDTGTFWGIAKLTNWIVLRKKDWVYKSFFNAKENDDFHHHCDQVDYITKAPTWQYAVIVKKKFIEQNLRVVRLNPELSDELQVIVQDNLTALLWFHIIVQWHVVVD